MVILLVRSGLREELAVLTQTPASEKLARLEELLSQRQESLTEQKAS